MPAALLAAPSNVKHRVMLMAIYGAGLRVSELVALQATDIDSRRKLIRVRQGKGRKDREVLLPARLLESLRAYWKACQPIVWLFPGQDPQRPITTRSGIEVRGALHPPRGNLRSKTVVARRRC
jgi:site-specific recombinase XerD